MMKFSSLKINSSLILLLFGIVYSFAQINVNSISNSDSEVEYEYEYENVIPINSLQTSSKQTEEVEYEYEYVSDSGTPLTTQASSSNEEVEYEYEYVYEDGNEEIKTPSKSVINNTAKTAVTKKVETIEENTEYEAVKTVEKEITKPVIVPKKAKTPISPVSTKRITEPVVVDRKAKRTNIPVNDNKANKPIVKKEVVKAVENKKESIYSEEIKEVIIKDNIVLKDISCEGTNDYYSWSSRIHQNPWIISTVDKYGNQLGENKKNISISVEKDIKLKDTAPKSDVVTVTKDPNPFDKINQPTAYELWKKAHANNTVIAKIDNAKTTKNNKTNAKKEAQLGAEKCAAKNKSELESLASYYRDKGYKVFLR